MKNKNINKLYLESCNTGLIDYDNNVADVFLNNYNINANIAIIASDGGTGYSKYVYFDDQESPHSYYHIRLAHDQSTLKSWRKSRRSAKGRVMYTKDSVVVLGNSILNPGTVIDGKKISMPPA